MVGEEGTVKAVDAAAAAGFAVVEGEEKKEVIVALAFGFLAVEVAMSPALRLRGVTIARSVSILQLKEGKGVDQMKALYLYL